jgi:hypothetical protein
MPHYHPSIQKRLDNLIQEMEGCTSCGMGAGDGGFTGDASPEGPNAGFDPVMGKLDKVRKKRRNRNLEK